MSHVTSSSGGTKCSHLHDAAYQDAEDVGLQQRTLQTDPPGKHALSAVPLHVLPVTIPPLLPRAASFATSSTRVLLSSPVLFLLFLPPAPPLLLPPNVVHGVSHVDEAGRGHEDDLQHLDEGSSSVDELPHRRVWQRHATRTAVNGAHPVSYVGDGERPVVANVLAARLLSVAVEILLLVAPRRLGGRPEHQDAEDKQDGEPHLQEEGRGHVKVAPPGTL